MISGMEKLDEVFFRMPVLLNEILRYWLPGTTLSKPVRELIVVTNCQLLQVSLSVISAVYQYSLKPLRADEGVSHTVFGCRQPTGTMLPSGLPYVMLPVHVLSM